MLQEGKIVRDRCEQRPKGRETKRQIQRHRNRERHTKREMERQRRNRSSRGIQIIKECEKDNTKSDKKERERESHTNNKREILMKVIF